MANPKFFPLFKFGYVTSDDIIGLINQKSETLETFATYKFLLKMQKDFSKIDKNMLKNSLREVKVELSYLTATINCLLSLDKINQLNQTMINYTFKQVDKILTSKQPAKEPDKYSKTLKTPSAFFANPEDNVDELELQKLIETSRDALLNFKTHAALDT